MSLSAEPEDILTEEVIGEAEEIVASDDFRRRSSSIDDRSSALLSSDEDSDDTSDDEDIEVDVDGDDGEFVSQLIDIREPLTNLRRSLEKRMGQTLRGYQFMLQETQMLSDEMTLADQCIQSEGLVQIKMMVANGKINIMDVLKPEEDLVTEVGETKRAGKRQHSSADPDTTSPKKIKKEKSTSHKVEKSSSAETVTRWSVSKEFRDEQTRLRFPTDPLSWDRLHVAHWLNWVQTEFPDTILHNKIVWDIDGRELCALSHDEFKKKVMQDPGDTLWTHLELLRKCKFVAVLQHREAPSDGGAVGAGNTETQSVVPASSKGNVMERKTIKKPPVRLGAPKFSVMSESSPGNRTGNNGQVQLWQFLLELLTEKDHCDVIHWCGDDGEFKLRDPEVVAQLWGTRKNKPNMNYEKLSRALRYYYDGDMISKVHGKRFTYQFVCNLKDLIGYGPGELRTLVQEAQMKSRGSISVYKD